MEQSVSNLEPDPGLRTIAPGDFADAIFSSDGSRMFAVSGNVVSVIDVATGNVLVQYTVGTTLGAIDVSPDGMRLAVVERSPNADSQSRLYEINLSTGAITTHAVNGTSGPFFDVSFLADGTALVSQQAIGNGSTPLRLIDFANGQFSIVDAPGNMGMATMTASADNSHVLLEPAGSITATGSYLYVSGQGFVAQAVPPVGDPYGGAGLPSGTIGVQATSSDGSFYVQGNTLNVYDSSLQLVTSLAGTATFITGAQGLSFSAEGQRLYVAIGSSIIIYSTSTWQPLATYDAGGLVKSSYDYGGGSFWGYGDIIQASPDGRYLSVITSSGLQLIDLSIATYDSTNGSDTMSGEGTLYGLGGNDDLSGVGTFTTMYGGEGDDAYHITGYSDTAWELPNQGRDTVHSIISFGLGENFEDLVLDGTDDIGGYGNQVDNVIVGNGGNNELGGAGGNDTLQGGAGDDKLDGGTGDDILDGGTGNDSVNYISALGGVTVNLNQTGPQNTGGAGLDTLISIENLSGSWQDDQLTGNSGANRIDGFVGNDILTGGLGADTLTGGDGFDVFKDTAAGLNGDTVADFSSADKIIITDANIANFQYSISGNVLTFTGGSITLGSAPTGPVYAFAAPGGGVQLQIGPLIGTMDQIASELTSGYWNGDVHRWNVASGGTISYNASALSFTELALARAALTAWSDITGIRFREVSVGAQITFSNAEEPGGPVAYADTNWSNGFLTSATIVISTSWVNQYGTALNSYSYQTYLHEIGHALGLGHSGDYNETANYPNDVIFYNDSWAASVMSYFDQDEAWYQPGDFSVAYAVTPMQADILAIQSLYGLSATTRLNDSVYGYNSTAGNIYNASIYPSVAYTIFDNGGNDTLDFSGWAGSQVLNLNPETYSSVNGLQGNVAIARSVIIENAIGGGGYDTIIGNAVNNRITGGLGADMLTGGAGNDTFRDTKAGLNGDTITDFGLGDTIIFTDASLAGFAFNLSGAMLTYTGGSLTLSTPISGNIVASAAAGGGVQLTIQAAYDVRNDFNGDGRSDLLLRYSSGTLTDWLGNASGSFTDNWSNFSSPLPTSWQVAVTGDFNGDGRDDLLLRHSSGTITDWLGNPNGSFTDNWGSFFAPLPTSWSIAGVGDFNNDSRDDLLLRHSSGTLTTWLGNANGGFTDNWSNFNVPLPTAWAVAGVGDFNGDGRDDMLLRHTSGTLTTWLGNATGGFTDNWSNFNLPLPTQWTVVGIGDFNGDGRDDMLLRNAGGTLTTWLGNATGGFTDNWNNFNRTLSTDWQVEAIGDYNGDRLDDMLLRHTSGTLTNWLGAANGSFTDNWSNLAQPLINDWQLERGDYLLA